MLPIVACWLGLSFGLYFLVARVLSQQLNWQVPLAMLLLGWLLVDSRWLHELWRRTEFTQHQYSNKTQQQKWQSENDRQWFLMISQLKQKIPEPSARIFQVLRTRQPLDDYYRFRVRYHLLPHNVFPYLQTLPKASQMKRGDYILDLGSNSELRYDSKNLQLIDINSSLSAMQLKYQSRLGRLYQFL
jgi:hypothetical protein